MKKLLKIIFIFLCIITTTYAQNIYINELLATNSSSSYDENGEYDDFIEIYIPTSTSFSLNGYYLTDYINDPTKWSFPDSTVSDTSWMIIWADDDEEQGEMHASFQLNGTSGEGVYIFDNSLVLVDSVTFGSQTADVSYGRTADGGSPWTTFVSPTPGFNNEGIVAFTADATTGEFEFTVAFTDQTPVPAGISISSWSWTFGDGQTSTSQNPTITYPNIGVYDVQLTITFNNGATDYILKEDYITVIERFGERTFLWNTETSNSESYHGLWSYDDSTDNWLYIGWPPQLSYYYADFGGGTVTYDAESDRIIMWNTETTNSESYYGFWSYDYNIDSWEYLGWPPQLSYHYADFDGGTVSYDTESDRIIMWNTDTYNDGTYYGFWSYDYNIDSWEYLGWPDENINYYYYADFGSGTITYDDESDRILIWNTDTYNDGTYFGFWSYDYNTDTWEYLGWPDNMYYYYADFSNGTIAYEAESDRIILWNTDSYNSHAYFGFWSYDYNTDTWEYLGWPDGIDNSYADFNNGTIAYDTESDRIIVWNDYTSNSQAYFGFWSYDNNSDAWEYLGWPDQNMPEYYYADFNNGTMAYGGYFYIGPDWYVSHSGNDTYSVTRGTANDPFLTIQNAIIKAYPGHTIWIEDGTWTEALDLDGKHLTIRSINSGEVILDGTGLNDALLTISTSQDTVKLMDLVFQNASVPVDSSKGGALDVRNSYLVLDNVTLQSNHSGSSGGALFASNSYVEFQSCVIDTNTATTSGGNIHGESGSTLHLVNTTLKQGDASQGGGLYATGSSSVTLSSSTVTDNHSTVSGGGLSIHDNSSLAVNGATVSSNTSGSGSAIYLNSNATSTFDGATISGNTSASGSGAIALSDTSSVTMDSSLVTSNTGVSGGGLSLLTGSTGTITASQFTSNTATSKAGALMVSGASTINIDNNIFYGNTVPSTSSGGAIAVESSGVVTLAHSKIDSNSAGYGSAFSVNNASISFDSSKVMRNASENSTAVIGSGGTATVTATIFYDNDQDIDVNDTSSVTLDWTIIYESNNDSSETFNLTTGSSLTVTSSMVQGTQGGITTDGTSSLSWEADHLPWYGGNLPDVDPLFCAAPGDLDICEDSQCIIFDPNDPGDIDGFPIGGIIVGCAVCGQHGPGNLTITDQPDDQGGYIEARFTASYYDTEVPELGRVVEIYQLWRKISSTGEWIGIASIGAIGAVNYVMLGSTPQDSTSQDSAVFEFKATAHMDEGTFTSAVATGYSVDNTAPFAPDSITVVNGVGNLLVSWTAYNNPDLYYWEVFKNGALLVQTAESQFEDTFLDFGGVVTYTIRGIDTHENVGDFSEPFAVTNGILGDVTWDGAINVLDVLLIADIIINEGSGFSDGELWAAELNNDGTVDIFDLVQLVDYIMDGGGMGKVLASDAKAAIYQQGSTVYLSSSAPVYGLQLTLSRPVETIVNQTDLVFIHQDEKVLMYSMGNQSLSANKISLFELPQGITIERAKVAGPAGQRYKVALGMIPETFAVHQNYPNPFNPNTSIQIDLPEITQVRIIIYDARGREITTLLNEELLPGYHTLKWNGLNKSGRQVASGIYFIHVRTDGFDKSIKATLLR